MLAERLCAVKNLNSGSTVLVIGEGLSAAVLAASFCKAKQSPNIVISRQEAGFASIQRSCTYRYIDPYIYDWPHLHHAEVSFPLNGSPTFSWRADFAHTVATEIVRKAGRIINDGVLAGRVTIHDDHKVVNFKFDGSSLKWITRLKNMLKGPAKGRKENIHADLVVICGGMHHEQDKANSHSPFISRKFWERYDDLFDFSIPRPSPPQKVLLVGGGDGVLQDFLYLLTGEASARTLVDRVSFPTDVLRELQSWNSAYLRSFVVSTPATDSALYDGIQHAVERICHGLLMSTKFRSEIENILLAPKDRPLVTIACRNWYFSHCFPLNRVLACLVGRVLASQGLAAPFRMNVKVSKVDSLWPHTHQLKDSDDWASYPVNVTFSQKIVGGIRPPWMNDPLLGVNSYHDATTAGRYDRLLVRGGPPDLKKAVPSFRAIEWSLQKYYARCNYLPFIEHAPARTAYPNLSKRVLRQLPPFDATPTYI